MTDETRCLMVTKSPSRRVLARMTLQQVAHRLAVHRGLDPDRPRGLRKVTRTL